jgi:hypothetical protein
MSYSALVYDGLEVRRTKLDQAAPKSYDYGYLNQLAIVVTARAIGEFDPPVDSLTRLTDTNGTAKPSTANK